MGKNIPKLTILGNAVNLAARMEQTSEASKVHVSSQFHDVLNEDNIAWGEKRTISVKNMGNVETYLLDPLQQIRTRRTSIHGNNRRILNLSSPSSRHIKCIHQWYYRYYYLECFVWIPTCSRIFVQEQSEQRSKVLAASAQSTNTPILVYVREQSTTHVKVDDDKCAVAWIN